MLKIVEKRLLKEGELWISDRDRDDWIWSFMTLPTLWYQDAGMPSEWRHQEASDLNLWAIPLYACRLPSVMFFPYVTYFADTWFDKLPSFVIPNRPLDREKGRYWLHNLASSPFDLINGRFEHLQLTWLDDKKTPVADGLEFAEIASLASAAKMYLLDEVRYVYDESKSAFDHHRTNTPSRHFFSENISEIKVTKEYLDWYIDRFNALFNEILRIGREAKPNDSEKRMVCLVAGLTVNRLAVDALTILSTDAPAVRKWQLFGFIDTLASLINLLTKNGPKPEDDKKLAQDILRRAFYDNELKPVLEQIPVEPIRDEVISHTNEIYDAIYRLPESGSLIPFWRRNPTKKPGSQVPSIKIDGRKGERIYEGPELLWAYRNARHGYALGEYDRKALLRHSGKIPDNLPDLTIALWHYILLKFPFH